MKKVVVIAVLLFCCSLSVFAGGKKDTKCAPKADMPIVVKTKVSLPDSLVVINKYCKKVQSVLFIKKDD